MHHITNPVQYLWRMREVTNRWNKGVAINEKKIFKILRYNVCWLPRKMKCTEIELLKRMEKTSEKYGIKIMRQKVKYWSSTEQMKKD